MQGPAQAAAGAQTAPVLAQAPEYPPPTHRAGPQTVQGLQRAVLLQ